TGVNPWDLLNNAIVPKNNQYDLLLGGSSTASAKFALINNAGGTPTASIAAQDGSGSALGLTPNSITTQNGQTLTLGGTSTGNIILNSAGSTALTATGANLTGAGTFTSTGLLTASNAFTVSSGTITFTGYNTGVLLSNNL